MIKLRLVEPQDATTKEQRTIVRIIQKRSTFWAEYTERQPIALSKVYNAMCGWLMGAFPKEFEIDD